MTIATSHHCETWVPSSYNKFASSLLNKKNFLLCIDYDKNLLEIFNLHKIRRLNVGWWGWGKGSSTYHLAVDISNCAKFSFFLPLTAGSLVKRLEYHTQSSTCRNKGILHSPWTAILEFIFSLRKDSYYFEFCKGQSLRGY